MNKIEELSLANLFSLYHYISQKCPVVHIASKEIEIVYTLGSIWPRSIFNVASRVSEQEVVDFLHNQNVNKTERVVLMLDANHPIPDNGLFKLADRWMHMGRKVSNEVMFDCTDEELVIDKVYNEKELIKWVTTVSINLFSGLSLDLEIFANLSTESFDIISVKKCNSLIATALVYYDEFGTAGIYMVSVDKEYQGKGIGLKMMQYTLDLIRGRGNQFCVLQSTKAGFKMYKKLQFETSSYLRLLVV